MKMFHQYYLTIEHVLNFITTSYLVNNELKHVYENLFAFLPEIEMSIRRRSLRRFRQGYRNIFPLCKSEFKK